MTHMADLGPLYWDPSRNVLAVRIAPSHANVHGIAHGGFLATLVDCALGTVLVEETGTAVVTAQMALDYLSSVKMDDWVEAHVTIDKRGRRLIYATCHLKVGDRNALKANAIFAVRG
ncbi:PaaI family thioesterase [Bordetella genomosp. 13]|uniref:PaaI family thioesterase n=1 Tax=Bordetella genomosp. 13 TaxID=463040 RepID=UPI0011A3DCA4|nr:PaaI family thioesterase [Bordetella genomosp. 13]